MASSIYHTIIFFLLLTLTLAQVRIPITRKIHLPQPAFSRRFSTRASISGSLANDLTQASYVISIKVGTPPQDIDLIVDTGSSDTWLITNTANSCTGFGLEHLNKTETLPCITPYNPHTSSSMNGNVTTDTFLIEYMDGRKSKGSYIADTFTMGNATVQSLQMGLASTTDIRTGTLGLGYSINVASNTIYPNIIDELVSQKLINTRAYSLYLDSADSSTGYILFGAVDTSKFAGELVGIDIVPQPYWNGSVLYSLFAIELVGLGITDQQGKTTNFTSSPQAVLLDSGTSIMTLPPELTSVIFKYFSAYDDTNSTGNVYLPCSLLNTSSDLTMNYLFSSSSVSATIKIPLSELIFPLSNPIYTPWPNVPMPDLPYSDDVCAFGIQTGAPDNYFLGDTFLRSAYVVYDLEHNQIGIAQADFDSNGSDENIVELNAGQPAVLALSSAITSASASTTEAASPTTSGSQISGTSAAAKPTETKKSGGAVLKSENINLGVLGCVIMGGLIFSGGIV
ncbi:fc074e90-fa38-44f9-ac85-10aa7000ac5a [Sclerotinia trifoliorum]|uniref:Fc074e90-fa38-44f9-ac85-10aa7000ac5a n=1 Tax=Sclerotinia trifoliorum TaxID=28548 RepID=A0A8H2ZR47_9HELO|nr:fc074e90-fa38-44f9-ac85-10aa7000ac5a [Sclerotinia trifoliorum]